MSSYFSYSSYTNNKINDLENQLTNKADISYVDACFNILENETSISNKADISYVDACFNLIEQTNTNIFFLDVCFNNLLNNGSFENDLSYWNANDISNISVINNYTYNFKQNIDFSDNSGNTFYTSDGDKQSGFDIELDETGEFLIIGNAYENSNKGAVRIFRYINNEWVLIKRDAYSNNVRYFGRTVHITNKIGNYIYMVAANNSNASNIQHRFYRYNISNNAIDTYLFENLTDSTDITAYGFSASSLYDSINNILYTYISDRSARRIYRYNIDLSNISTTMSINKTISNSSINFFGNKIKVINNNRLLILSQTNIYIYKEITTTTPNQDILIEHGGDANIFLTDITDDGKYILVGTGDNTIDLYYKDITGYSSTNKTFDNNLSLLKFIQNGDKILVLDVNSNLYTCNIDDNNTISILNTNRITTLGTPNPLFLSSNASGSKIITSLIFDGSIDADDKIIVSEYEYYNVNKLEDDGTKLLKMKPTILYQNQNIISNDIYDLKFYASAINKITFTDFSLNIRFANDTTSQEIFSKTFTENDVYLDSSNNYILNDFSVNEITANDNYTKLEIEVSSTDITFEKLFIDNIQLYRKDKLIEQEVSTNIQRIFVNFNIGINEYIIYTIKNIKNISFTIIDNDNSTNIGSGGYYYIKYNSNNTISLMRTITTNQESWNCDFFYV